MEIIMNQTILFTPVGGTDPISLNNYHDGSILHICRFYKPDKVILYMSKEMLDFQEKDDRYRYCLDRLAKMQEVINIGTTGTPARQAILNAPSFKGRGLR